MCLQSIRWNLFMRRPDIRAAHRQLALFLLPERTLVYWLITCGYQGGSKSKSPTPVGGERYAKAPKADTSFSQ